MSLYTSVDTVAGYCAHCAATAGHYAHTADKVAGYWAHSADE